ncbi:MAG: ABC transporter permease [Magnetococcales bacterium]|nr:ABC transporter permease [Magnetococcales bacterium]
MKCSPVTCQRWRRFRYHRRGWLSLWLFVVLFGISLLAELISNDRPVVVYYDQSYYFPILFNYPERQFGGDFDTEADYKDPFIHEKLTSNGNWAIFPPNPHRYDSINTQLTLPAPSPPTAENRLGTDDRGRDVLARLIYGFRLSVLFALGLTAIAVAIGLVAGAVQGYFGGRTDLYLQRFMEIWGSLPELYLLIIFSSLFEPNLWLLVILLSLFGWMGLADYVRAEFLRARQLTYAKAARAMGVSHPMIIFRHLLPNTLTPVITFLPFRISGAVLSLTSLDFLGLGVPPSTPSLGELLRQGKANIEAWWLSLTTFVVLSLLLLLLNFIGEALRDAMDPQQE